MADYCVVDTDVVSFAFRSDSRAAVFDRQLAKAIAFIFFMTVAELQRWAIHRQWGDSRKRGSIDYLDQYVVILADQPLCRTWAEVTDQARRKGRPIQVADAWIAATAVRPGLPLVTNNRGDFAGVDGLRILDQYSM